MRYCLFATFSILLLIAEAFAQAPEPTRTLSVRRKPYVRHAFAPLSREQKTAALKFFQADLKLVVPGGSNSRSTPTYTLTAASPNNPTTGAYLNFWGTCDQIYWDPNPISTHIAFVLGKRQYADVEVHLGNVKPGKTYLVTFNVVATDPKKVTMLTQTFSNEGNLLGQSSFQPTSVIQGQVSIPIVVNPGANGATLNITPAEGDSSKTIAEFTVESVTVEQL